MVLTTVVGESEPVDGALLPVDDHELVDVVGGVPPEAYEHRGKWLVLRGLHIVAIHDSEDELYADPILSEPEVTTFYVPTATSYAL